MSAVGFVCQCLFLVPGGDTSVLWVSEEQDRIFAMNFTLPSR